MACYIFIGDLYEEEFKKMIISMARYYLFKKNGTLKSVAHRFDISESAVSRYFNNQLKLIDYNLYMKVRDKKAANIKRARQNIINYNKSKKKKHFCFCHIFGRL